MHCPTKMRPKFWKSHIVLRGRSVRKKFKNVDFSCENETKIVNITHSAFILLTTCHNLCFSSLDLFVLWPWSKVLYKVQHYIAIIWGRNMNFEGNMANSDWIYTVKEPIFRQVNNAISYQPGVLKIQRETKMRKYIIYIKGWIMYKSIVFWKL